MPRLKLGEILRTHIDDESIDWEAEQRLPQAWLVPVKLVGVLVPLDRVDGLPVGVVVAAEVPCMAPDNERRDRDFDAQSSRQAGCNKHNVTLFTDGGHEKPGDGSYWQETHANRCLQKYVRNKWNGNICSLLPYRTGG